MKRLVFGSVADAVAGMTAIPVLLVKPGGNRTLSQPGLVGAGGSA